MDVVVDLNTLHPSKEITLQSKIILVAGIILSITIAIFAPRPYNIWIAIYFLFVAMIAAYNVNCAQVGHCYTWAWILTVTYVLSVILMLLGSFFSKKIGSTITKSVKKR